MLVSIYIEGSYAKNFWRDAEGRVEGNEIPGLDPAELTLDYIFLNAGLGVMW
jgi:hypothetical protein